MQSTNQRKYDINKYKKSLVKKLSGVPFFIIDEIMWERKKEETFPTVENNVKA